MLQHDKAMMILTIQTLIAIGQVFEVRALGVQGYGNRSENWCGFFQYDGSNASFIVNEICKLNTATGIYITINPVTQELLALGYNKMGPSKSGASTGDKDILARRYLPVDVDPCRKAGTSTTESQTKLAYSVTGEIFHYMKAEGFGEPIAAFSGNGYHLLYPINEPVDDNGLVQHCLQSLAQRFDTDTVKVDCAVHNPARIMRLYGTVARKGDEVPQLQIHHRLSQIISVPTV
jgi:hypothetical protein